MAPASDQPPSLIADLVWGLGEEPLGGLSREYHSTASLPAV